MSASAANLTGTVNTGEVDGRPSVFELVSHQSFSHALRPALFHIIKTLAERYPEGRIPLLYRRFDEFYLSFDSLVQWHYILTRGATLSEAFYGLERKLISKNNKLTRIRVSYLLSVIFPYIQQKLDKAYQETVDSADTDNAQTPTENNSVLSKSIERFKQFLKFYPYLKAVISSLNLAYLLAFAFGYAESHNFVFRLLGMRLSYTSPDRSKFVEEKTSEIFQSSSWRNLRRFPILAFRSVGESVLLVVEMGSFFVQFLDWWYNDPRRQRVVLTSLPVPPPPTSRDQNCVVLSAQEKDKCPMCRGKFRNPTALSTSGIVYCYGCIVPHLKRDGTCPLSSLKSTMDHLIRLYP